MTLALLVPGVGMGAGGTVVVVPPTSIYPFYVKRMKGTPMSRSGLFGLKTILIESAADELTYDVMPSERP